MINNSGESTAPYGNPCLFSQIIKEFVYINRIESI